MFLGERSAAVRACRLQPRRSRMTGYVAANGVQAEWSYKQWQLSEFSCNTKGSKQQTASYTELQRQTPSPSQASILFFSEQPRPGERGSNWKNRRHGCPLDVGKQHWVFQYLQHLEAMQEIGGQHTLVSLDLKGSTPLGIKDDRK